MRSIRLSLLFALPASLFANWQNLNAPPDNFFNYIWAINEQTIFLYSEDWNDEDTFITPGLWKTFNGGVTWLLDSNIAGENIYFVNDTLGFLEGDFLTIDGGKTWFVGDTSHEGAIEAVSFPKGQSLIGYSFMSYPRTELVKTTDAGRHWNEVCELPEVYPGDHESIDPWEICFPSVDTGYITVMYFNQTKQIWGGIYYKTVNGGESWTVNKDGAGAVTDTIFYREHVDFPENPTVGYMAGYSSEEISHVLKTTDGGATWDTVLEISTYISSICFPENDQVGYVFGDSVVNRTLDGGKTWQKAYLTNDSIWWDSHFLNNSVGFITGRGPGPYYPGLVFKTTDGLLGISEEDWVVLKPELIELKTAAFFTNELEVSYGSKSPGYLKAEVFDASGREVRSLGVQTTSSKGTVLIPGADLSSGVYFVRVEFLSGEGSETKTLRTVRVK